MTIGKVVMKNKGTIMNALATRNHHLITDNNFIESRTEPKSVGLPANEMVGIHSPAPKTLTPSPSYLKQGGMLLANINFAKSKNRAGIPSDTTKDERIKFVF